MTACLTLGAFDLGVINVGIGPRLFAERSKSEPRSTTPPPPGRAPAASPPVAAVPASAAPTGRTPKAAEPAAVQPRLVEASEVVHFATAETTVSPQALAALAAVAKSSRGTLHVAGHADNRGVETANDTLSRNRAEAVARQLVSLGVAAERITTSGWGATRPVKAGNTAAAWQANRRVDITYHRGGP
jgi:OmpA-OmpF porin, OOP family